MAQDVQNKRLFFGLGLGASGEDTIAHWLHSSVETRRAPVKTRNLHLTLAFLAEVDGEREKQLIEFAKALSFSPFSLTFSAPGYWPHNGIFYLKPDTIPEALGQLAEQLRNEGERLGLYQNPYVYAPHITLYRRAKPEPTVTRALEPLTIEFNSFSLYHSHSTEDGLRYDPIATFYAACR